MNIPQDMMLTAVLSDALDNAINEINELHREGGCPALC